MITATKIASDAVEPAHAITSTPRPSNFSSASATAVRMQSVVNTAHDTHVHVDTQLNADLQGKQIRFDAKDGTKLLLTVDKVKDGELSFVDSALTVSSTDLRANKLVTIQGKRYRAGLSADITGYKAFAPSVRMAQVLDRVSASLQTLVSGQAISVKGKTYHATSIQNGKISFSEKNAPEVHISDFFAASGKSRSFDVAFKEPGTQKRIESSVNTLLNAELSGRTLRFTARRDSRHSTVSKVKNGKILFENKNALEVSVGDLLSKTGPRVSVKREVEFSERVLKAGNGKYKVSKNGKSMVAHDRYAIQMESKTTDYQPGLISRGIHAIANLVSGKDAGSELREASAALKNANFEPPTFDMATLAQEMNALKDRDFSDLSQFSNAELKTLHNFSRYTEFGIDMAQGIYASNAQFAEAALSKGAKKVRTYEQGVAQAAVVFFKGEAGSKDRISVAVQGTNEMGSMLADLRAAMVAFDKGQEVGVPVGFLQYTMEILLDVLDGVGRMKQKSPKAEVDFFGHSLGAAGSETLLMLAQRPQFIKNIVTAQHARFIKNPDKYPVEVARYNELMARIPTKRIVRPQETHGMSFGSPRATNEAGAKAFNAHNGVQYYSYRNDGDIVTAVPPKIAGRILSKIGKVVIDVARKMGANYAPGASGTPSAVGQFVSMDSKNQLDVGLEQSEDASLSLLKIAGRVTDHFMTNYRAAADKSPTGKTPSFRETLEGAMHKRGISVT